MNPNKNEVYSAICDYMKQDCKPETIQKLDDLKQKIKDGFESPVNCSLEVFGVNLFIFEYKIYEELYGFLNTEKENKENASTSN